VTAVLAWLLALAPTARALPGEFGDCPLPRSLRHLDGTDDETLTAELERYRTAHPEMFAVGVPTAGARTPADFEPKDALHVVLPDWPEGDAEAAALVAAAMPFGRVVVHLMSDGEPGALARARARWPADRVDVVQDRIASVWIRDFGGLWAMAGGRRTLVDGSYYADCVEEDAWPTRFADHHGIEVRRNPLPLEGGNLLSDGLGTCFTTTSLAERAQLRPKAVSAHLRAWLGCERVVMLEPLVGDESEHVDVFLSLADAGTLLLAEADPVADPENHHRLELQARALQGLMAADGRPYRVTRVPLAPSIPHPETGEPAVRSYLNLLPFNGGVIVPRYEGAGAVEERAFAAIQAAFADRVVVGVPADHYVRDGGAIHCVTWTVPARP